MFKVVAVLIMLSGPLFSQGGVKVESTGEIAKVFCFADHKPSDISIGNIGADPLQGEDLRIFNAIKSYWEKKTGTSLSSKMGKDGWTDIYFVALIKGDRIRFSTKDNSAGSLASGVVMSKWQEDSLGVLRRIDGKWVVYREEGPEYKYNFHEEE
ncbi:MAG TPA: hypothetical protein VMW10_10800 [Alphaproteobacteria bacterium]|nr:hypothetical protein [Alphaproteobacteria bacterium]